MLLLTLVTNVTYYKKVLPKFPTHERLVKFIIELELFRNVAPWEMERTEMEKMCLIINLSLKLKMKFGMLSSDFLRELYFLRKEGK